ncbi:hypothetical protein NQ176_g1025 [Zarea fungicola]|uniref:Uncharacterized protein n=1 Tax=Zarea fungicola TaxID=93591 RepID=A0ACC1NUI8_9HYPO|nr:hypothetical protein NQ176_g1025 [Lecanicillium fungicola]
MQFFYMLAGAISLTDFAAANFHIGKADKVQLHTVPDQPHSPPLKFTQYIACPSNYMNCNCYGRFAANADRGVEVAHGSTSGDFSLKAGLCGMGQLDFYKRSGGFWEFYVNNGNGDIQGTCYKNSAELQGCGINPLSVLETNYDDQIVCYSYICGE